MRKLYQNLSIDEPLPRDPELEVMAAGITPEQIEASFEPVWFSNPGGHFRRRILEKLERAGVMNSSRRPTAES